MVDNGVTRVYRRKKKNHKNLDNFANVQGVHDLEINNTTTAQLRTHVIWKKIKVILRF